MSETTNDFPLWSMDRDHPLGQPRIACEIQAQCPVSRVGHWDGSAPWVITRYEDVKAILSDPQVSADSDQDGYPHLSPATLARKGNGTKSFVNMDGPEHAVVRRRLAADFTVKKVEALRPKLQATVHGLIDHLVDEPPPADLVKLLARPVPSMVVCEILGIPYADREFFEGVIDALHDYEVGPAKLLAADAQMREYLGALVEGKNKNPDESLLGRLAIEQFRTGNMSRDEIAGAAYLVLSAGQDITSNMIAMSVVALLTNPVQLAEIRDADDPGFVAVAVEEMLRYLGPSPSGRRRVAAADIEVGDQRIRQGEGIIVASNIANHDPAVFPNPETLDLRRNARGHGSFGYGEHNCLGHAVARMELQVVLGTLFRRLPNLKLAVPLDELRFTPNSFAYGVRELPVVW